MALLSEPLPLYDANGAKLVDDVERLCRAVLLRNHVRVPEADVDDVLSLLIGDCWRLSTTYDAARDRRGTQGFPAYASRILDRRLWQWSRERLGRAQTAESWYVRRTGRQPDPALVERHRQLAQPLSLDAPAVDDGRGSLGATLADRPGHGTPDRGPALDRLLNHGSSSTDRDFRLLRAAAARRPTGRA